jgi:hypothetical protein
MNPEGGFSNMTRSPLRSLFALSFLIGVPTLLLGCPKKTPEVVDAGAPEPVAVVDAAPAILTPLEEDAGFDAGVDAAVKKPTGPVLTSSQRNVKACCSALHAQAKAMGTSPESAQIEGFAGMCDGLAMQVGPSSGGQAPELEPLRVVLRGKPTIPALCKGL